MTEEPPATANSKQNSPDQVSIADGKKHSETTYDPYEFRTDGTIGDFASFLHLVKCSFGSGVLTFPYGFKNAGVIMGFLMGCIVAAFCIWCFHIVIKMMMKIAADERKPYVSFQEAVTYSFTMAGGPWSKMSRYTGSNKNVNSPDYRPEQPIFWNIGNILAISCSRVIINSIISLYHFGICTAYMNFLVTTTLKLMRYDDTSTYYRCILSLGWVVPLFLVNCLRDLKTLMPFSLLGNITTLASMLIILYYIVKPTDTGFDSWKYVPDKPFQTAPLFIGLVLFAVESFGVIISIEKSMTKPRHFGGILGVFNISMTVVVVWYLFIGSAGYFRYGEQTQPSVTFNIPLDTYLGTGLQYLMGTALYCSYPLQCYVVIEILWGTYLEPKFQKRKLFWEMVSRFAVTLATGIVGVTIPRLDLIVGLTGCICLSLLAIIMPAVLEYNFYHGKYKWARKGVLVKDIFIICVGVFSFFVGTYATLFELIVSSDDGRFLDPGRTFYSNDTV